MLRPAVERGQLRLRWLELVVGNSLGEREDPESAWRSRSRSRQRTAYDVERAVTLRELASLIVVSYHSLTSVNSIASRVCMG